MSSDTEWSQILVFRFLLVCDEANHWTNYQRQFHDLKFSPFPLSRTSLTDVCFTFGCCCCSIYQWKLDDYIDLQCFILGCCLLVHVLVKNWMSADLQHFICCRLLLHRELMNVNWPCKSSLSVFLWWFCWSTYWWKLNGCVNLISFFFLLMFCDIVHWWIFFFLIFFSYFSPAVASVDNGYAYL